MKFLCLNSLILVLLVSGCTSIRPDRLVRAELPSACETNPLPVLFAPDVDKKLYKIRMDIKEHRLTGLLLIKAITNNSRKQGDSSQASLKPSYRILFSNEFGMTYFDLNLTTDSLQVLYCFEPMRKKALISILETDFRLLLGFLAGTGAQTWYRQRDTGFPVRKTTGSGFSTYTTYSTDCKTINRISGKTNLFDVAILETGTPEDPASPVIRITNPLISLRMKLSQLNN